MKFHPRLLRITIGSIPVCFVAFYFLSAGLSPQLNAVIKGFGWLIYMFVFAFFAPLYLSFEERAKLMQPLFEGTKLLIVVNLAVMIWCWMFFS